MFSLGLTESWSRWHVLEVLKDAQYFSSHRSEGVGNDDPGNQMALHFAWSIEKYRRIRLDK